MAILYRHIRSDRNEVFYVGIGKSKNRAFSKHGRNKLWKAIVNRNLDYITEIILEDLSWEEACKKEVEFIKLYGRINTGTGTLCNLTDGGEGTIGVMPSKYTLLKRSLSLSGENNPNYGKSIPEWHKEINRKAQLGRKHTKETIEKRVKKLKGQKRNWNPEKIQDLKNRRSSKIIDTSTMKIYNSIKEAAIDLNIKRTTLNAKLAGQSKNNTNLVYLKDFK